MFPPDTPDLAARLAQEICSLVSQMDEPYRSRLAAYIGCQALGKMDDLNGNLRAWFEIFEPQAMIKQYEPLYSLAKLAQAKFPRRER